jgi:hypothetical protein
MKKILQLINIIIIFLGFLFLLFWSSLIFPQTIREFNRIDFYSEYLQRDIVYAAILLVVDILYGVYLFFALKLFNTRIETNKLAKILFNPIVAVLSIVIIFILFAVATIPGPAVNIIGA